MKQKHNKIAFDKRERKISFLKETHSRSKITLTLPSEFKSDDLSKSEEKQHHNILDQLWNRVEKKIDVKTI